MRIWERMFIESHLTSDHGPVKIAACTTAFNYGFTVPEIAEISGLPVWRVQQAILKDATKRTGDD
jgi:hypothetical protein